MELKEMRSTTIDAISYVALAIIGIGAILSVYGVFAAMRDTYEEPRTFVPLIQGISTVIGGFFMLGFRYVVEAAIVYLTQKELEAEEQEEE